MKPRKFIIIPPTNNQRSNLKSLEWRIRNNTAPPITNPSVLMKGRKPARIVAAMRFDINQRYTKSATMRIASGSVRPETVFRKLIGVKTRKGITAHELR
jgi:hypothetical protein